MRSTYVASGLCEQLAPASDRFKCSVSNSFFYFQPKLMSACDRFLYMVIWSTQSVQVHATPQTLWPFSIVLRVVKWVKTWVELAHWVFFYYIAGQSKKRNVPVGGVLVFCSSSSNIIITVAVSACTVTPSMISNQSMEQRAADVPMLLCQPIFRAANKAPLIRWGTCSLQ